MSWGRASEGVPSVCVCAHARARMLTNIDMKCERVCVCVCVVVVEGGGEAGEKANLGIFKKDVFKVSKPFLNLMKNNSPNKPGPTLDFYDQTEQ